MFVSFFNYPFLQPSQLPSHIDLAIETPKNTQYVANLKRWSRGCAYGVISLGMLVLLGWLFDIGLLKSVAPSWVTMKVNTAIGLVITGSALLASHHRLKFWELTGAWTVLALGLLTTAQYVFDINLGIDEAIFPDDPDPVATYVPGRMALNTALAFSALGISLGYQAFRRYRLAQFFAIVTLMISFLGCLGYVFSITTFYGIGQFTEMALHTGLAFIVLSLGILGRYPDRGGMGITVSELAGGATIRRLIGLTFILPTVGCGLVLWGKRAGFYDGEVGLVLLSVASVFVLGTVIWWNARTIGATDYQALYDNLTGLPNRILFRQQLSNCLREAREQDQSLAVFFIDIDCFKKINDTLGHDIGDEVLQLVTRRILAELPPQASLSRWGGDEFTLLLRHSVDRPTCERLARRLVGVLSLPFDIEPYSCYVSGSIGIASYPQDGDDAASLMKHADIALHRSKETGRGTFQFYQRTLENPAYDLLLLERELHLAVEQQQFVLLYQPKLSIKTGQLAGMEALIRWNSPRLGQVSPQEFIALAEENGLIVPIGEWVLYRACEQIQRWRQEGFPAVPVAVNLSARQFLQSNLVQTVRRVLETTQVSPEYLELEITETIAIQNVELTQVILQELREMGVRIALDDFGMGYSSLAYLKNFPLNALKIDRSFVQDITTQPSDRAIASVIVALGRGLGMKIVAEGVETVEQMQVLSELDCDEIQGYWLSPARPGEALGEIYDRIADCQPQLPRRMGREC
ncbi:putative bifunctional diguanylate cyclase/phosphodiesterase [Sodalinema gerasimenkoae]|uniref:putative bifunctional diguanylate cyclase/phosphodiesterase n=1 Tax=Sodalinema gerasimenkoae TaxID=2862348 RepID=UPI00135C406C|nr:EAL domain-containing protein [Sodalinema gerasimenkoae]